jgi:methyl-accepting chemotaxis protein
MRWSIGSKIGSGFALALAGLVLVGGVSYDSTTKLIDSADWVAHTHQVLNGLDEVLSTLKDAETGQRGYVITGEERYLEPYQGARDAIDQRLKNVRTLIADNPAQQRRLDALEPLVASKFARLQQNIELRRDKGFGLAQRVVATDQGKKIMDDIRKLVGEMENEENALLVKRSAEEKGRARRTELTIMLGGLCSLGLIILVGVFLTRDIASPLRKISGAAQQIASGDLTVNVPSDSRRDEVGVLAGTFTQMTQSLRRVTGEMQESVNILSTSAQQIVATTTQVASGAAETAAAVSETTTTLEEVKQTAQLSAQKAKYVSDSAQKAAQVSQDGKKSVEESIEVMKRIREQMESIAESIVRLSEQSQAIGDIMLTVSDLAEQSNLLAVNASIEAAKAGEQGKGFAVVAQEVRSLAEQSKQATTQVRGILSDIQKATSAAVMATEQGSKAVDAGVTQSGLAGESVQRLAESIAEAAQAATQIAASSQQQMIGMDQVALAMESIKAASTQNVASTKQTETAAKNVQELGRNLKELVAIYRV